MTSVAAAEFTCNFDRYSKEARLGPLAIVDHSEVAGYFVSAHDFDEYQRLRDSKAVARSIYELDDATIEALRTVRMDPRHNHLNALMD